MFVAASTDCFSDLPLDAALERLVDLEYNRVEIVLRERGNQLKPSQVHANLEEAVLACRETHRLTPIAYVVDIDAEGDLYYEQFSACCKLAKATKVVTLTVPSGELGTPFNAEIETAARTGAHRLARRRASRAEDRSGPHEPGP